MKVSELRKIIEKIDGDFDFTVFATFNRKEVYLTVLDKEGAKTWVKKLEHVGTTDDNMEVTK